MHEAKGPVFADLHSTVFIQYDKDKHLKKSNTACFYTPIVLKLLIIVQM